MLIVRNFRNISVPLPVSRSDALARQSSLDWLSWPKRAGDSPRGPQATGIIRAGMPTAVAPAGTSVRTTALAPIRA